MNVNLSLSLLESGYYATVFIAFLYFCTNPFIYAVKFEPVKRILVGLIPGKKQSPPANETVVQSAAPRTLTSRITQTHH